MSRRPFRRSVACRIAWAIAAMLMAAPFTGAQAQSDRRQDRDPNSVPGYGRPQDGGNRNWRGQQRDNHREQWRRPHQEIRDRDSYNPPRPQRPRPYPYPYPGSGYAPPPYPGPAPAWRPAPYPQPVYPAPVYIDDDVMDAPPPPKRRPPARVTPERTVAPQKPPPKPTQPPRRPPPAVAAPQPPAPARADSGVPVAGETRFAPSEVLVTLSANSEPLAGDLARAQRLRVLTTRPLALTGVLLVRYQIADKRSVAAVITALERDARVLSAQPNYLYVLTQSQAQQRGALTSSQYGLERLRAGVAHLSATGDGVPVAVIDSGVDDTHRELAGAVISSVNVMPDKPAPDAHGTAIAGIIAARDQMRGVAPAAPIIAIRAFAPASSAKASSGAHGSSLAVILALEAAVAAKARVVNMSFAGPRDPLLSKTLAAAAQKGVILVAAAGNDGPDAPPAWPAADPHVIAVTATDVQDQRLAISGRGDHIAIAAPGADIIGPAPGNAYQFSTGSSMAAAHVSGAVALLLQANPKLTAADVRKALTETAKDLDPAGRDPDTGAGLTDAGAAVDAVKQAGARALPQLAPAQPENPATSGSNAQAAPASSDPAPASQPPPAAPEQPARTSEEARPD